MFFFVFPLQVTARSAIRPLHPVTADLTIRAYGHAAMLAHIIVIENAFHLVGAVGTELPWRFTFRPSDPILHPVSCYVLIHFIFSVFRCPRCVGRAYLILENGRNGILIQRAERTPARRGQVCVPALCISEGQKMACCR